jgi:hypothetical protein
MGSYHADYTGSLTVSPRLNPAEIAYFTLHPDELCYGFLSVNEAGKLEDSGRELDNSDFPEHLTAFIAAYLGPRTPTDHTPTLDGFTYNHRVNGMLNGTVAYGANDPDAVWQVKVRDNQVRTSGDW